MHEISLQETRSTIYNEAVENWCLWRHLRISARRGVRRDKVNVTVRTVR